MMSTQVDKFLIRYQTIYVKNTPTIPFTSLKRVDLELGHTEIDYSV